MRSHTRRHHAKEIFITWWALMYGALWGSLCSADVIVSHYASSSFRAKWDAAWLAPKWGWRTTVIGFFLLTLGLIFEKSFRMVRTARKDADDQILAEKQAHGERELGLNGRIEDLQRRLDNVLSTKPALIAEFEYAYQQASLSVTNNGTVAEVWASLRIDGPVNGKKQGMFARWVNADTEKVTIAKGETRSLVLAFRQLSNSNAYMSQWEAYCAGDPGRSVMPALYTNAIGNESATPDIHLYVKVFSDPDSVEPLRERHIVLHPNRAEELSN